VAHRAPHLHQSLRAFCLAAFAVERGAELPFAFEEHPTRGGPSLYEYRPLVRGFVEEQAPSLRRLPDARNAIDDLRREPAAAIFAHAHSGVGSTEDDALFRTILLPLLTAVAERCGGFDWQDEAFDGAYAGIELSLFGTSRSYAALAPLVGLSAGATVELGSGIRVRKAVAGEVASLWPEARGLMPPEFGRDVDRLCLLELSRDLDADEGEPPDSAGELADAVSAPGRWCSSGSTSVRCGSRRCCRSRRRSRTVSRSGSTRCAGSSPPTCGSGSSLPTTTVSWPRRSTAGSCRCSRRSRSAPGSCTTR
jgi:hypothetical protein